MIKQPESYNKVYVEEALDIEIAVANEGEGAFFKTETNYEIDFRGKLGLQKTDFTAMHLEITEKMINGPLLIFFRGMNYTHDELRASENKCQTLYMELEFRSTETKHVCSSDLPVASEFKSPVKLESDGILSKGVMSFSDDGQEGFFYQQDFYLNADNQEGYDLTISLSQKFTDEVTIVPLIEIRATEQDDPVKIEKTQTP